MQDQKSLALCWRSFLGGGHDIITGLCTHKGGQYSDYSFTLLHSPVIIQDTKPEIGDIRLTHIPRMG